LRDSKIDVLVLAAMLAALVLFAGAHQGIWEWLTLDLHDGSWMSGLTGAASVAEGARADLRLVGVEGRFVWAASALVLLVVVTAITAIGAFSILESVTRWRPAIAVAIVLVVIGVPAGGVLGATAGYQAYMNDIEGPFQFSRYLLSVFAPYYEAGARVPLLDGFAYFEQVLPALIMMVNIILLAALLVLAWPAGKGSRDTAVLARRVARFRLLLVLGSALFTTLSLYYLSQYAWFAQVLAAGSGDGAEQLRALQRGVTLYLATVNSLAIVLLFAPPGWILWRRSLALSHSEVPEAVGKARSEWLESEGLNILSGPVMRVAVAAAPLLVSGGLMLLETALMGA
jgi:hypothetical protein